MTIFYLLAAIGCETAWAIAMKTSDGFTRPLATGVTIACYLLSVVFLALASRRLELGAAYAIWAGSGVALIAIAGSVHFCEPMSAGRAISILLIVAGIVGVHLSSGPSHAGQRWEESGSLADPG